MYREFLRPGTVLLLMALEWLGLCVLPGRLSAEPDERGYLTGEPAAELCPEARTLAGRAQYAIAVVELGYESQTAHSLAMDSEAIGKLTREIREAAAQRLERLSAVDPVAERSYRFTSEQEIQKYIRADEVVNCKAGCVEPLVRMVRADYGIGGTISEEGGPDRRRIRVNLELVAAGSDSPITTLDDEISSAITPSRRTAWLRNMVETLIKEAYPKLEGVRLRETREAAQALCKRLRTEHVRSVRKIGGITGLGVGGLALILGSQLLPPALEGRYLSLDASASREEFSRAYNAAQTAYDVRWPALGAGIASVLAAAGIGASFAF